jgi:hypothetical protein
MHDFSFMLVTLSFFSSVSGKGRSHTQGSMSAGLARWRQQWVGGAGELDTIRQFTQLNFPPLTAAFSDFATTSTHYHESRDQPCDRGGFRRFVVPNRTALAISVAFVS